jgi:hypothetical protein
VATGDQTDFEVRLRQSLPTNWFPQPNYGAPATSALVPLTDQNGVALLDQAGVQLSDQVSSAAIPFASTTPVLDGVLAAISSSCAWIYGLIQYVGAQSRLATASGSWLDARAQDYLGTRLPRLGGEGDAAYSLRVRKEIVRERVTRRGLIQLITDVTGYPPESICEPNNPPDCGGWDTYAFAWDAAGFWGSDTEPYQVILVLKSPVGAGIPIISGWDSVGGGWDAGSFAWIDLSQITGGTTQSQVFAAIASVLPIGVTAFVAFDTPGQGGGAALGSFVLGVNTLS